MRTLPLEMYPTLGKLRQAITELITEYGEDARYDLEFNFDRTYPTEITVY